MASLNAYPSLLILSLLFLALNVSSTQLTCPPSPHKPSPKPSPKPHKSSCPRDTVKLGACSDLLGGLLDVTVGQPPKEPCCSLLEGLTDTEAAACLCTAVKAKLLGINLKALADLSLLLNYCGKKLPPGFLCA
ncbi:hypothetical protein IEQ34_014168 [Dendrobium chrysotoxum]|uniref:Bifunctional inhibitor/plant lipid transfer protein/seed storage helical domain-containing protein n=1 Tax=Dendrobium chrysotoxum TaxID=161865 RepID=A0AAV7GJH4_DENCH|nr:hypothetical protein IEQ34_014168 [Dendrobium chrysotoxum]